MAESRFPDLLGRIQRGTRSGERLIHLTKKKEVREMIDVLTGLSSRHWLHMQIPEYAARATAAEPLALLLLRVKDFSLWQERLTPLAADSLLTLAAEALQRAAPANSAAARWENDTFALLLPDCPVWRAEDVGEKLRDALQESVLPMVFEMQNLQLDLCYGAAASPPVELNSLTQEAERQLRRAGGGVFAQLLKADALAASDIQRDTAAAYIHLAEAYLAHGDPYLRRHGQMTAGYAQQVGRRLGMSELMLSELSLAAAFADIAMAEAAGAALAKPGCLTPGEFNRIKRHPVFAAELAASLGLPQGVIAAVRSHHERLDGSGYPDGLHGREIPLAASVLGACGAFAAMLLPRPYRPARKLYRARAEISEGAGRLWPAAVAREIVCL